MEYEHDQGITNLWWWRTTLDPGAAGQFSVAQPTNGVPWRLTFSVYNDMGAAQIIKRFCGLAYRYHPYVLHGGWFEGQ
ncbi:MAG TPA: hypothetical protein VG347_09645 [Verrucomicrobiae bacterium]|nr:hypothetical protein [Verrucomicrobiae bacterium]